MAAVSGFFSARSVGAFTATAMSSPFATPVKAGSGRITMPKVTHTLQDLQKHSDEFEDFDGSLVLHKFHLFSQPTENCDVKHVQEDGDHQELNRGTQFPLIRRRGCKEVGICTESDSEGQTLDESSETQSTSTYISEPYDRCSLSTEQLSGFLNDDLIDSCCSESKSRLDEHHIFINRLVFQYQHLSASVEELKVRHEELCHCSENRGHVVSQLVTDSEVQHAGLMILHSLMERELNTLNHDFNEMHEHLEKLRERFESQRIEHTSLTADFDVWCNSVGRQFNKLGQDNEELCRLMKSLEEEFELKNIEHSRRLREQVICVESKIVDCNGKFESYQNESVASQQQLGIINGVTRGASLFPMTSQTQSLVPQINSSES